jgi:hypothetical protein
VRAAAGRLLLAFLCRLAFCGWVWGFLDSWLFAAGFSAGFVSPLGAAAAVWAFLGLPRWVWRFFSGAGAASFFVVSVAIFVSNQINPGTQIKRVNAQNVCRPAQSCPASENVHLCSCNIKSSLRTRKHNQKRQSHYCHSVGI